MRNILILTLLTLSGCMFNAIDTESISLDYKNRSDFVDFNLSDHPQPFIDFRGTENKEDIIFQSSNGGFVEIDINKTMSSALAKWKQVRFKEKNSIINDTLRISIPEIEIDKNVYSASYKAYELKFGIQLKVEYFSAGTKKIRYFNKKKNIKIHDHNKLKPILKENLNIIILDLIKKIDEYYYSINKI